MAGTLKDISGPAYLATSVADIYTPPAATIYTVIKQIHIANVTGSSAKATLYKGATGGSTAGTEILKGKSVPANDYIDLFFSPGLKMSSTQFLSGLSDTATALTISVIGEQVVV